MTVAAIDFRTGLQRYARTTAKRAGIDPETFVRQINQESGFNPDAFNAASGASGIAQIIERWHPAMAGKTRDPEASLDYAADLVAGYVKQFGSYRKALASFNWGSGNVGGYVKTDGTVVAPWDGKRETLPAETRRYLDVILGDGWPEPAQILSAELRNLTYNTAATVDPQPDDWSCSLHSAQWLLRAIGRDPKRDWLVGQLVGPLSSAPIISREYGLMDASGRAMAAWLQREYGDEMGITFEARNVSSWEDAVALASRRPYMLGGRTWGHWTGVRDYKDGKLQLANPAGSWKGVGQEMDRDEWDALGAWSLVTPTLPAPGVGNGPATTSDEETILGLRVAIAHLVDKVIPKAAAAAADREAALAEAARIRDEFLGAKV